MYVNKMITDHYAAAHIKYSVICFRNSTYYKIEKYEFKRKLFDEFEKLKILSCSFSAHYKTLECLTRQLI